MNTEILIVSYQTDKPWLEYCLRSIKKFCEGFSGVTVVVPSDELEAFAPMIDTYDIVLHAYERVTSSAQWHLQAQAQKCKADLFCPHANFILHTDSDCIFTEPITPSTYMEKGRPVMLFEAYSRLRGCPWQSVVTNVLQHPVEHEFMRRHPQVNPWGVYADLRKHIEDLHHAGFESYVLTRKPDFPWGFTEHNIIGAFAYYSPKWHTEYHWIDLARHPAPHEKLFQFWSKGPIDGEQPLPHAGGKGIPLDVFKKLGLA